MTFRVRVINKGGDGLEGRKVQLYFGAHLGWAEDYTDPDGEIKFDKEVPSGREAAVRIDGYDVGKRKFEDGKTYRITHPRPPS